MANQIILLVNLEIQYPTQKTPVSAYIKSKNAYTFDSVVKKEHFEPIWQSLTCVNMMIKPLLVIVAVAMIVAEAKGKVNAVYYRCCL